MRTATMIGIICIVLGICAFGYQGVVWVTGQETVAKAGPVEVTRQKDFPIPLAPIIGGVAIAVGLVLVLRGADKST